MTDDEARKLALRCIDTWPNGPKAYVWKDFLVELDAHLAAAAYRHLAAEATRAPTIAQFLTCVGDIRRLSRTRDEPTGPRYDGPVISFGEYMLRLQARAGGGDTDAAYEIERWERFYGKDGAA